MGDSGKKIVAVVFFLSLLTISACASLPLRENISQPIRSSNMAQPVAGASNSPIDLYVSTWKTALYWGHAFDDMRQFEVGRQKFIVSGKIDQRLDNAYIYIRFEF